MSAHRSQVIQGLGSAATKLPKQLWSPCWDEFVTCMTSRRQLFTEKLVQQNFLLNCPLMLSNIYFGSRWQWRHSSRRHYELPRKFHRSQASWTRNVPVADINKTSQRAENPAVPKPHWSCAHFKNVHYIQTKKTQQNKNQPNIPKNHKHFKRH